MARTSAENKAIHDKVGLLLQEGFPVEQATAIAFRMFRDGELDEIIAGIPILRGKELAQHKELEELRIEGTRKIQLAQEEVDSRMNLLKRLRAKRDRRGTFYGRQPKQPAK